MIKFTLLMGTAEDEEELTAVNNDIKRMMKYLISPYGGGWRETEILLSFNESRRYNLELMNEIRQMHPEYFLFYWSGHGETVEDQQILKLVGDEIIALGEVCGVSQRQLIVLDTCRDVVESPEDIQLEGDNISRRTENIRFYRRYYEKCIEWCEPGLQISFACARGNYSYFDDDGGKFTTALIEQAENWQLPQAMNCGYKSIKTLMKHVYPDDQEPKYFNGNQSISRTNYPFSIRLAKNNPVSNIATKTERAWKKSTRLTAEKHKPHYILL